MKGRFFYTRTLVTVAVCSALLCVSSMISIPLGQIPLTLQTLVIFFSLYNLGAPHTALMVGVYLALGAAGVPVFSGFGGGVGRLLDATGGFLLGLLPAVGVYGAFGFLPRFRFREIFRSALFLLTLYTVGTLWYAFVYLDSAPQALAAVATTVLPFVIPDILKAFIAYRLSVRLSRYTRG